MAVTFSVFSLKNLTTFRAVSVAYRKITEDCYHLKKCANP